MIFGRHIQRGTATWTFLTVVLVLAAALNGIERLTHETPYDGATWVDAEAGVVAARIDRESPVAQVGVQPGDRLLQIGGVRVGRASEALVLLDRTGSWNRAEYSLERDGKQFSAEVVVGAVKQPPAAGIFQSVLALAYLAMGAFVFFRGERRRIVELFYAYCLSSFALYGFSYTGSLGAFDRFTYWADVWATALTPALFLHFCWAFPRGRLTAAGKVSMTAAYGVAAVMIGLYHGFAAGWLGADSPILAVREFMDRLSYGLLGAQMLLGAAVLRAGIRAGQDPTEIQQRRWLSLGAFWGVAPFCVFYVVPFIEGRTPGPNHTLSIFALALIPTSFLFAMARNRLMDVDLIVRRGTAYTLATAAVLAGFYGGVFVLSGWIDPQTSGLGPASWVFSVVLVALLFHPLRSWIQRTIDRRYYRERYDYRQTLADFAAELAAETDPEKMLASVGERLTRTLGLRRMAIFVAQAGPDGAVRFEPAHARGFEAPAGEDSAPAFLSTADAASNDCLFFENPAAKGGAVASLDLNCYAPCKVQGRTIAWFGLGRTEEGEFLSSEDLALVRTVSGHFAIALENARLYRSLETKARQYQRLKDYNENIVESLHVGILAADLDDRVESWNTQLELVFGISRQQAIGRKLEELLPAALVEQLSSVRGESGVHNIYKLPVKAQDFPHEFRPAEGSRQSDGAQLLNVAVAPLVAKNFEPIGRLIILDDVTERVAFEEQVVQADKLSSIGLLAAGVAHEVNTPLAVISSYAQMLAKQIDADGPQHKVLEKITQQTFRASEIVNSLLSFSRTASNEFADLRINDTITETAALIEPQLRKAQVEVQCDFAAAEPIISGAAGKLQQVFLNLFLNARDAMPQGGTLRVGTKLVEDEGVARITVSDSGVGIRREQLAQIFDPFFTTKGPKQGTGLGLAVSYGIIKEHGGSIAVDSKPGEGTTFTIELPLVRKPIHA